MNDAKIRLRIKDYDLTIVATFLIVGVLIIVAPWLEIVDASNNYYLLSFLVLILLVLLFYFFPLHYLTVRATKKNEITLELIEYNRLRWCKQLKLTAYWWNYTEIENNGYRIGRVLEQNPNHPKNSGTGNMDSSGIPTEITLHVKLEDEAGTPYYLFEEKGNWASIPAWSYRLDRVEKSKNAILCKGLKKMIDFLVKEDKRGV